MAQASANCIRSTFGIADINSSIDGTPRMMDLTLAEALGFARPSNIRRIISRHVTSLKRFGEVCSMVEQTVKIKNNSGGRPGKAYYLNKKQALYICTKSETENATEVTIQMVEVFDAYTSAKPIHVREHDRRTSTKIDDALKLKRNVDRLEKVADKIVPPHPNFCAMVIDGESVFVDVNDYDLRGERAAVITWDGKVAILETDSHLEGHKFAGVRSAHGPKTPGPRNSTLRNGVIVIGKVVGYGPDVGSKPAAAIADAGKQIEHEGQYRGRRTIFKDEILQLIGEGMPNRQIAQRTGATYQTVTHWRRWAEDRRMLAGGTLA